MSINLKSIFFNEKVKKKKNMYIIALRGETMINILN